MILPGLSLLKDCVLALYPEVVLNSILQPISTLRGHLRTRHSLHSPHSARAAPFKQWSEDDLQLVCKAVGNGWTIHRAADEFGVPKSTLYDQVSGHISSGARSGPPRYLNDQEEKQLVNFLIVLRLDLLSHTRKCLQSCNHW